MIAGQLGRLQVKALVTLDRDARSGVEQDLGIDAFLAEQRLRIDAVALQLFPERPQGRCENRH